MMTSRRNKEGLGETGERGPFGLAATTHQCGKLGLKLGDKGIFLGQQFSYFWSMVTVHLGAFLEKRKPPEESGIQGYEAFPDGVLGEFSDAMRFQLIHNLLAVGIHCLDADLQ